VKESVLQARTLSDVALILTEAAKNLFQIAKYLADMSPSEWMTALQTSQYLGCESVKAFEKIVAREGIPKHYLSARAPRYNRVELDEWLLGRRQGLRR
jgi:hypothetical protein